MTHGARCLIIRCVYAAEKVVSIACGGTRLQAHTFAAWCLKTEAFHKIFGAFNIRKDTPAFWHF